MLTFVECQGTSYEMGRQYGEACRDQLAKALEMNINKLRHFAKINREDILANAHKFLPQAEAFDPELIAFLRGEAEGAGIHFDEAFYLRCSLEILLYYGKIASLCTSFAATGMATKDGKTILGQNIDWFSDFPVALLKLRYASGLGQLALSFGGVAEYVLSSRGFGLCANLTLAPRENYRAGLPYGCYLPKVMRQEKIGDALGVLCQVARGTGYYQLASSEGDLVGYESTYDDFNVLHPDKDMQVHANHYLTERFQKGDWGYTIFPDTYLRVNRIKRLMELQYGEITPEVMMKILSDHNNYPDAICRHANQNLSPEHHSETLASFIMVPEERKMYIAYGNPCQSDYLQYTL
ncbi:C45 family autoproteolytic acyltransferase/hydolase [Sporomusa acidovorans]|uniref:Peptidase C45 hydrolase domain-containing protein n=1 Tax=Sporomusa acidovorans (strain ATCC 49682 / DSM 3132 / Mol) TaxID=1123286 RepID=A0ABZ3J6C5_SPOA4|nr:C45 family peptidase [Sporomusa acidovorans]OZC18257.1 acyl-coenzyme A:6-aminopenicillanic acid acyl-transferase [Sporomusa acidovorans DSM 3132]SDF26028.1 isopenicillin-N N-acyltransferase like protein [Sporomusa acidovorans]